MRRFFRKHKLLFAVFNYLALVVAAFELGAFLITRNMLNLAVFFVFITTFLSLKFYARENFNWTVW